MSGKNKNSVIIIYSVLTVIYVVAFLVIPFEKNATFWIAFSFGIVSIIAGLIIAFVSFEKGDNLKSKVYGLPIFKLGYAYTIVQIILTIVLAVLATFSEVPYWIALVSGLILLGVLIIGVVAIDNARDYMKQQETRDDNNTKTMEGFRVDLDSLVAKCSDENLKKELEKLAEEFRYSDPVSSEKTKDVENHIREIISGLSESLGKSEVDVNKQIDDIRRLLNERNSICKNNK